MQSAEFAPAAMWLGVFGIVYGAVSAFGQNDTKRLVAYTSISHMGFILVGVYAGTEEALQGVVIQMLAHGISAGALHEVNEQSQVYPGCYHRFDSVRVRHRGLRF
jgi:NADH-quinone oxidoreductase subunit M